MENKIYMFDDDYAIENKNKIWTVKTSRLVTLAIIFASCILLMVCIFASAFMTYGGWLIFEVWLALTLYAIFWLVKKIKQNSDPRQTAFICQDGKWYAICLTYMNESAALFVERAKINIANEKKMEVRRQVECAYWDILNKAKSGNGTWQKVGWQTLFVSDQNESADIMCIDDLMVDSKNSGRIRFFFTDEKGKQKSLVMQNGYLDLIQDYEAAPKSGSDDLYYDVVPTKMMALLVGIILIPTLLIAFIGIKSNLNTYRIKSLDWSDLITEAMYQEAVSDEDFEDFAVEDYSISESDGDYTVILTGYRSDGHKLQLTFFQADNMINYLGAMDADKTWAFSRTVY